MVTSKSTVLGIRLDHDRRAWVESEAAEQGVTVRVLFERMIDRARAGETEPEATAGSGSDMASSSVPDSRPPNAATGMGVNTAAAAQPPLRDEASSSVQTPSRLSPCSDLARVAALSGEMIHTGFSLTTALIETGGHCFRWSWKTCTAPVVRSRRPSSSAAA